MDKLLQQLQDQLDHEVMQIDMSRVSEPKHTVVPNSEHAYTNLIVAGLFLTGLVYMFVYFFTDL